MRNLSSTFRHEMYYGNHNYDHKAVITLADGTVLTLTNTTLWAGGFSIDDAVSEDNSFTALGSAVIGSAKIIVNNIDESYSQYDFTNAKVTLSLSKTYLFNGSNTTETIKIGKYTVDECVYNGGTITLSLLDNMEQFDRPYGNSNLSYPATLTQIVQNACQDCGVTLNTYQFPHYNYVINTKPEADAITYRDVIGWVATIATCFARCNADGQLELKWFDTNLLASLNEGLDGGVFDSSTPYSSGDNADGGSFNPWNTGDVYDDGTFSVIRPVHYLSRLYSQSIGVDDIVITGVHVIVEERDTNNNQKTKTYKFGRNGYVIKVQNNKLIDSTNAGMIGTWISNALIGMRFRNANVTHLDDPSIEAGDIGVVIDRKQNEYPILVTRTSYSAGGSQTTVCGAESASRNSATRFSDATKAYVDARKLLNEEQTAREQAVTSLYNALAEKSGLYSTQETAQGGGTIYYLHDKPLLEDSMVVWKMTAEAWGVSTDGGQTWNAGMTVNGDVIARILTAIGVNADWINTGALTVWDSDDDVIFSANCDTGQVLINAKNVYGDSNFYVNSSTGEVHIIADSFSLVAGDNETKSISDIADDRIDNANIPGQINNAFTQSKVFNALTNNGTIQGIFMQNGQLYINMSYLRTGELQIYRNNVETMYVNGNTGEVRLSPTTFRLNGQTVPRMIEDEVDDAIDDAMTQQAIFNKLTNNGQTQGIMLVNGQVYINWEYAVGGTLVLGGYGNARGTLEIWDSTNEKVATITNAGFRVYDRYLLNLEEAGGYLCTKYDGSKITTYFKSEESASQETVVELKLTSATMVTSGEIIANRAILTFNKGVTIDAGDDSVFLYSPKLQLSRDLPTTTSASYSLVTDNSYTGLNVQKLSSSSKRYKIIDREVTSEDVQNAYNINVYMASYKEGYLHKGDIRENKIYPMFIAEQVEEHLPIAVDLTEDGLAESWNERILIPVMFQMIKDQKTKIDEQENEIKELKEKLSDIESKLTDILNVYKLNNTL